MTALYVVLASFLVIVIASRIFRPVEAEAEAVRGPEDIASLARSGKKIAAIKAYRQMHGVGLREAKEAVERIAAGEALPGPTPHQDDSPFARLNTDTAASPRSGDAASLEQIRALIRSDNMIQAIKVYRELHGCGLKEAKDAVERISQGL